MRSPHVRNRLAAAAATVRQYSPPPRRQPTRRGSDERWRTNDVSGLSLNCLRLSNYTAHQKMVTRAAINRSVGRWPAHGGGIISPIPIGAGICTAPVSPRPRQVDRGYYISRLGATAAAGARRARRRLSQSPPPVRPPPRPEPTAPGGRPGQNGVTRDGHRRGAGISRR